MVGSEFGTGVRKTIESTGLTQRQLAEVLGWQEAKLSDMLAGKGGVSEVEVITLLAYYRTPLAERERLLALFRESGNVYLQMPEDGVPDQVGTLIEQEKAANEITCWSMILVPGLLQTVDTHENIPKDLAAVALDEEQSRAVINSILERLQ